MKASGKREPSNAFVGPPLGGYSSPGSGNLTASRPHLTSGGLNFRPPDQQNTTRHLERPNIPPPHPRGLRRDDVERIFAIIPVRQTRDILLFRLVFETGLRISEALNIHLDDLDLARGMNT